MTGTPARPRTVGTPALPRAVLLDLDDTILSLSETALALWHDLCERFAPRLACETTAEALLAEIRAAVARFWADPEQRRWGGHDLERARRVIVADAFGRSGAGSATLAFELADTFSRERLETIRPFPGALETLRRLRERGHLLALVTNGRARTQREKIERFRLAPWFDCIAVEEEVGIGKPDARVFRHVMTRLRIEPAEAWMVGDNLEADVRGAQGAGIHAIWHDHAGVGLKAGATVRPDRIVRAISELVPE